MKKDIYNLFDILRSKGRYGDTELAHVTPEEKRMLEARGGAGTINPQTGLREYHKEHLNPNAPFGSYWDYHEGADSEHITQDVLNWDREERRRQEEQRRREKYGMDVADVIKYDDYAQFINPTTGNIMDEEGFIDYLLSLDIVQEKGYGEYDPETGNVWSSASQKQALRDLFSDLGQLQVDPKDKRDKQYEYQSTLSDVHGELLGERQKTSRAIGQSGFYDPTAKGFGGTSLAQTSNIYGDLGIMPSQKQNIYGLGTGSEETLLSWIDEDMPEYDITG
tara:strand:- start:156 stop:989 length:834 start_codon:yes stop_codon:yes gene_type:complete